MTHPDPWRPTCTEAEGEEFRLHLCAGWHRCVNGTWAYLGNGDPDGFFLTYDVNCDVDGHQEATGVPGETS